MTRILPALVLATLLLSPQRPSSLLSPQRPSSSSAGPQEAFGTLRELPAPAAEGSLAPQLTAGPDRRVFLSWLEPKEGGGHRFRFSEWVGERWTEARTIHEGDDFFANWADVPSVFAAKGGVLLAHWLRQVPGGEYAYGIRMRSSTDGGRTWSDELVPHRDASPTEHGFLSFVEWPAGGVGAVWLDGRQTLSGAHDAAHSGPGGMSLRATTFQPPSSFGEDVLIDDRVCECCPTAAARTADGVLVAYRDRSASEVRDIYVARYANGKWTTGRAAHDDGWKIPACPVNGPALSAEGRRVALAWFTAAKDEPRVLAAFSADGGATFGRPIKVNDAATLGRVDVEWLPDGSALVLWLESEGDLTHVRARRVFPDGRLGAARTVARVAGTRASGHPRVARSGDDLIFAWRTAEPSAGIATAVAGLR